MVKISNLDFSNIINSLDKEFELLKDDIIYKKKTGYLIINEPIEEIIHLNDYIDHHNEMGPSYRCKISPMESYYLDDILYSKKEFAIQTNHKICNLCMGFCKQRCFL